MLTTQRRSLRRVDYYGVDSTASTTLRPQRDHQAGTVPPEAGEASKWGGYRNPAEAADP